MKREDCGDASTDTGKPKVNGKALKTRKGKEAFPYRFQGDHGPVDALLSDF